MLLTEYFDLSEDSLGVDHVLECFVYPLDRDALPCLGVLGGKNMPVCAAADQFLHRVAVVDRDDVLPALELRLPFDLARQRAHDLCVLPLLRLFLLLLLQLVDVLRRGYLWDLTLWLSGVLASQCGRLRQLRLLAGRVVSESALSAGRSTFALRIWLPLHIVVVWLRGHHHIFLSSLHSVVLGEVMLLHWAKRSRVGAGALVMHVIEVAVGTT